MQANAASLLAKQGASLVAISRRGKNIASGLSAMRLEVGDVILLQADPARTGHLVHAFDLLPLAERPLNLRVSAKDWLPIAALLAAILAASSGFASLAIALMLAVTALGLTGRLNDQVYQDIDWPIVILLAALIPIAHSMQTTGVTDLLGSALGSRGIELFSVIACGDQVAAKKPAPDIYQLALRHLGVDPEQAVALEDSRNGLLSAVRAGLWTVVTPTYWTEHQDFAEAGLVLPQLGEPHAPVEGEPGSALEDAGWLGYAELARRGDRRPRSEHAGLYEGVQ